MNTDNHADTFLSDDQLLDEQVYREALNYERFLLGRLVKESKEALSREAFETTVGEILPVLAHAHRRTGDALEHLRATFQKPTI